MDSGAVLIEFACLNFACTVEHRVYIVFFSYKQYERIAELTILILFGSLLSPFVYSFLRMLDL